MTIIPYKIANKIYGKFNGVTVYCDGFDVLPRQLKVGGGGFTNGKHILEILAARLKNYRLTICASGSSRITKTNKGYNVRLHIDDYKHLNKIKWTQFRDLNLRLVKNFCVRTYPSYFTDKDKLFSYVRDSLSETLDGLEPPQLSTKDLEALIKFFPKLLAYKGGAKDVRELYKNKQDYQLAYLERLLTDFEKRIAQDLGEQKWQEYLSENILLLQENYIQRIEKQNIGIDIKIPDFCMLTADNYIDVLEIKTPNTRLLSYDGSHDNFYWHSDAVKAIAQAENYLDQLNKNADALRNLIKDRYGIEVRVIRPRGIVIAGRNDQLSTPLIRDQFRLLNDGLKNLTVLSYDDMVIRIRNQLYSIKKYAETQRKKGKGKVTKKPPGST